MKFAHISTWLFAFLAIFSLSFLGEGCHPQLPGTTLTGAMVYTHAPALSGQPVIWPVYIDGAFTAEQQRQIDWALANWNMAFNGHARLVVVDRHFDMQPAILQQALDNKVFLILPATPSNHFVSSVDGDRDVIGVTPFIGGHWLHLVVSRLTPDQYGGVTMHELGHALGASHTSGGLMNAFYDHDDQCVDYKAIVQVAEWYNWDINTVNYCYWDLHAAYQMQGTPELRFVSSIPAAQPAISRTR